MPRVQSLIEKWNTSDSPPDKKEVTRRLLDLFLVSVLLDAGAGNQWTYNDEASGKSFSRSEGLGVASINMFSEGFFSGDSQQPHKVDGASSNRPSSSVLDRRYSTHIIYCAAPVTLLTT